MLTAVYFNDPYEEVILVAAFLMKTDADDYVKSSFLSNLKTKEMSTDAWRHFQSIRAKV